MCCFNSFSAFCGHIFVILLSLLYLIFPLSAFNIDTKNARVYSGNEGTYFGYSVALARLKSTTQNVLIGAPKDNYGHKCKDLGTNFNQTGVVFSCSPTEDNSCSQFCVHNLETNIGIESQNVSNAWLGAAIDINPNKDEFVTCGHRWKSVNIDDRYFTKVFMNGICTVNDFDNSTNNHKPVMFTWANISGSGTSVKYSMNGSLLIVGVPGKDKYPSGIILYSEKGNNLKRKNMLLVSNITNSYAGYVVSSGKFFDDKVEYYVMGVPRDGNGAVIITDEYNNVKQRLQSESEEIGSYFGMKVCVADINNDGLDDLLVGAPMETGQSREEGQVVVYLSDGKKLQKKQVLFGDKVETARFGSAITNIGDVDQDGFIDIAIGAPYENKQEGAIYIYNMNKEGFPSTYSQKITGNDVAMGKKMKGFGISISRSVDVNKDKYLDFLVGSYLSSQVRLLFSRPVLDLKLELLPQSKKINFKDYKCPNYGNKAVCFKVTLKFSYSDASTTKIDLVGVLRTGLHSQVNTSHNIQKFGFQLANQQMYEKEFEIIEKDHPNIFQPIDITIQMNLDKSGSCNICTILRTKTFLKKIPFELDCGDDDKCMTDLKVIASTSQEHLLYGKEEKFNVDIIVSNGVNHAYNSFATFVFPKYLQYIQTIKTNVQPDFECSTDSSVKEDIVRCTLGNPLPKNTNSSFSLIFSSTGSIKEPKSSINITVKTKSSEKVMENNKMIVNILNKMKAVTNFNGYSNPDLLSSEKKNLTVTHVFVVYNDGPSPLLGVTMNITLPKILKEQPHLMQRICKDPACPTSFSFGKIKRGIKKEVDIVFNVNEKIHMERKDLKYLETEAILGRTDHQLYMSDDNQWPWKISVRTNFQTEAEPVESWVIILCIICGVFLLCVIIVVCWKCGFFKRNKVNRDEEQKPFNAIEKSSKGTEENSIVSEKKTDVEEFL